MKKISAKRLSSLGTVSFVLASVMGQALTSANTALEFNGTNGHISVGNSDQTNLSGPFTLEAWIYPTVTSGTRDIIYKWSLGSTYPNQRSYFVQLSNGYIKTSISPDGTYAGRCDLDSTSPIPANQWSHVASVYDGSTLSLFINGQRSASRSTPGHAYAGISPVTLGGAYSTTYEPFAGKIDEVRISATARYAANFTPSIYEFASDPNTLLLMHFNEGSGTSTGNLGTASGTGLLNSGVSWTTGSPLTVPEPAAASLFVIAGLIRWHQRKVRREFK